LFNPKLLTDAITGDSLDRQFISESSEAFLKIQNETQKSLRFRKLRQLAMIVAIIGAVVLAGWGAYSYTQTKYYVSESGGHIAIYKGIKEELAGFKFSEVYEETDVPVAALPEYQQQLVENAIYATDLQDAYRILQRLRASVTVEQ
jgi:protein phosphatase